MMSNQCFGYGNQINQYSPADFMPLSANFTGTSDNSSMYNPLGYRPTNYYTSNPVMYSPGMDGQVNKRLRNEPSITSIILGQAQPQVSQMSSCSYNSYWHGQQPVQPQPQPSLPAPVPQVPCPQRTMPICQGNVSGRSENAYDYETMRRGINDVHERGPRHRQKRIEREIDREKRKEKQREREIAKQEAREKEKQKQLEKEEVRRAAERLAERAREMEKQREKEKQAEQRRRTRQKQKLMEAQQRQADSAAECPIWNQNSTNAPPPPPPPPPPVQNQPQTSWPLPLKEENVLMDPVVTEATFANFSTNGSESLQVQLRTCLKPVIGLNHIVEFIDPISLVRVYQCELCYVFRTTASILEHIISYKHRVRTLVKLNPNEANMFVMPDRHTIQVNADLISLAIQRAAEVELLHGRGEMQIRHEGPTYPTSSGLDKEDGDFIFIEDSNKLLVLHESMKNINNIRIESPEECRLVKDLVDKLNSAICDYELRNLPNPFL